MATSFDQLKKNRSFNDLNDKLKSLTSKNQVPDDQTFWKPTTDKVGNGYAVIRFLPAPPGEEVPFVRLFDHGFKGPGGWYIENSLTTLNGQPDPVSEYNSQMWDTGIESNRDIVRKERKRRLGFFSNIYVVKDSANPAAEGKIFKYRYGKKIYDKLNVAMNPTFEDDVPMNPFDLWEGANFRLKVRKADGYPNYDLSEFETPGPLLKEGSTEVDEEWLKSLWESEYSLKEIVDPKNFKSYDELKQRLNRVLGLEGGDHAPVGAAEDDEPAAMDFKPKFGEAKSPEGDEQDSSPPWRTEKEDDPTDIKWFQDLAKD